MTVLLYIVKLSVCLFIVWMFYQLVLKRLTFYTWNRWYLLVCTALAFLLPMINIAPVLEKNNWTEKGFVSAIPQLTDYSGVQPIVAPSTPLGDRLLGILPYLILAGALVMFVKLLMQYFSLRALRRSAQLMINGPVKVYQVNKPVIPFSFGNAIYINQHLHEEEELKEIIRHEFIHVKQKHSFDIIWSEIMCVLTWYNPFSWLLRKSIRQNLEFIADQQVLQTGLDKKQYQYLLLKVIGVPTYSIASNFNFKSLKKRIAMMNKVKTARFHLVRFLLLLPVVAIILLAFRNAAQRPQQQTPTVKATVNDTIPSEHKLPGNVRSFHMHNNRVAITLKNGTEEIYDLDNDEQRAEFEKKYGKVPEPPVPPRVADVPAKPEAPPTAPAAPTAPKHVYAAADAAQEYAAAPPAPERPVYADAPRQAPPAPPAPPETPFTYDVPEGVSQIHVKNYDAVVTKTDGTVERYNLKIEADKEKFEKKYSSKSALTKDIADGLQAAPNPGVYVPATPPVYEVNASAEWEVVTIIKNTMTAEELDQLKHELKENGYTLRLDNIQRKDGKITSISGKVNIDGRSGNFNANEFEVIIISREKKEKGKLQIDIRTTKNKKP